jgi:phosphoserine phosphatase RsbU/P
MNLKGWLIHRFKMWRVLTSLGGILLVTVAVGFISHDSEDKIAVVGLITGIAALVTVLGSLMYVSLRWLMIRLFFKVRNRIIANYVLTGILPLGLVLILLYFTVYFFMVQLVSYHLKELIDQEATKLRLVAFKVVAAIDLPLSDNLEDRLSAFQQGESTHFPGLSITVFEPGGKGKVKWSNSASPLPYLESAEDRSQKFLVTQKIVYLMAAIPSSTESSPVEIIAAVPLTGKYLEQLEREFSGSIYFAYGFSFDEALTETLDSVETELEEAGTPKQKTGGFNVSLTSNNESTLVINGTKKLNSGFERWTKEHPRPWGSFLSYTFGDGVYVEATKPIVGAKVIGFVITKYSFIFGRFIQGALPPDIEIQKVLVWAVIIIGGFFALIELIALVISLILSRSITKVIAQLHRKTQLISRGDFSMRLESKRKDQLGELAQSFDRMSDDLVDLLEKVKEKERLEHELEIAQEVQRTFFPKSQPSILGMQMLGKCLPARMVSGDYYDFIDDSDGYFDFFIGDISGKGISAALLMASSQTFLKLEAARRPRQEVADIVSHFNKYLVLNSALGKFSTLFYGRLEKKSKRLIYCNAGHLPPFLIRDGEMIRLTQGGMVPGVMSESAYEAETIDLRPRDLMVAFTDGFTEVFNKEDEEYGEDRLSQLIKHEQSATLESIFSSIVESIKQWSSSLEQADDMTILLLTVQGEALKIIGGSSASESST